MKKTTLFCAVAAAMLSSPAFAATELVKNGNFSNITTTSTTGAFQLTGGNTYGSVANWTTTGGYNLLYNGNNATTKEGNAYGRWSNNGQGDANTSGQEYLWALTGGSAHGNFLAIDGDPTFTTSVNQTITGLEIGRQYVLTFDWGAGQIASRTGATSEQFQVVFGDDTFTTSRVDNVSKGFSGWNTVSTVFTAKRGSQVLSFLSVGAPAGQPPVALLDNVSLTAAVPEPATWAMMLVGFGMVGAASRYRRRNTSVAIA